LDKQGGKVHTISVQMNDILGDEFVVCCAGYDGAFKWEKYLKETNSVAVPVILFKVS